MMDESWTKRLLRILGLQSSLVVSGPVGLIRGSEIEERKLKYIGGIAKNRNILFKDKTGKTDSIRIDEYAIGDIFRGIQGD